MRVALPLGRWLFFLCAFLFALLALLPLRVAIEWFGLGEHGLSAREANGSVWVGAIAEGRLGGVELGDFNARLRFLPLLVGRARLEIEEAGGGERFKGALVSTRHSFGVDDLDAKLSPGQMFGALSLASFDLKDLSVRFADGRCDEAQGRVGAAMAGELAGLRLAALSGNARCERGALLLPLMTQSGTEGLHFRLFGEGRYEADLVARPAEEGLRARLAAAGFRPSGDFYVLRVSGTL